MSKTKPTFKEYVAEATTEAYQKLGYSPVLDESALKKSYDKQYPQEELVKVPSTKVKVEKEPEK